MFSQYRVVGAPTIPESEVVRSLRAEGLDPGYTGMPSTRKFPIWGYVLLGGLVILAFTSNEVQRAFK